MDPLSSLRAPRLGAPSTDADDPRIGRWLAYNKIGPNTRIALVGFPSDEGVRRNGGRPGAAEGPAALRAALYRMTPDPRMPGSFTGLLGRAVDLGDVFPTGDLEADQQQLGLVVGTLLERGITPIVIGGGHETAFGHFLGYAYAKRRVHLVNWDAHPDVRPLKEGRGHSGSPFRQALEHVSGTAASYTVLGLHPQRVAATHAAYAQRHGRLAWLSDLDAARIEAFAADAPGPALASFDLDLVDAAQAPGVSTPGVGGLDERLWLHAAERCARSGAFTSFEVVELNPLHDVDGRTATLAALTVWHILRGIAARG
ncbi:MAG TPA: formimidoylglutamase [Rhodothermales bacterium]|nr:formimidoylglutamase [Rhodothermales bacterium]